MYVVLDAVLCYSKIGHETMLIGYFRPISICQAIKGTSYAQRLFFDLNRISLQTIYQSLGNDILKLMLKFT